MQAINKDEGLDQPATVKAERLLCEILPTTAREQFLRYGFVECGGKRAVYRILKNSQTEIYVKGSLYARACLQLTIPAPTCDRMIAEYLILRNDEPLYWSKANIEPVKSPSAYIPTILLLIFDIALLIRLFLQF
jgi:hypothetical protein